MESQINAADTVRRERTVAISLTIGAMLALASMDAALKMLAATYPPLQIVFMRAVVALVLVLGYVWARRGFGQLRARRKSLLLGRALLNLVVLALFVMALARMPLADATAVAFAAPFLITAFSAWFLRESVGVHRWGAVLVGLCGVLIIVRPGSGMLSSGAWFALGAAVAYALAMISSRALSRTETNTAIIVYNLGGMMIAAGVLMPWVWVSIRVEDLWLIAIVGAMGAIGQLLITQAYRLAPAAVIAPFDYTALIWATGLGYVFWGDLPGVRVVAGIAVVIGSGLYILHRETRRKRDRPQVV